MAKMYYDADAQPELISATKVAVIGYGSQGHAHALNLADSGVEVRVALRDGSSSAKKAEASGLQVMPVPEATAWADMVMFLAPDTSQREIYETQVKPNLTPGMTLAFAHGFNIRYEQIVPESEVNVIMIAPKGPGHLLRRTYEEGGGIPSLIAVGQDATDNAHDLALSYAWAIGSTKAGVLDTTFAEETETDLFGEQVVLCGGLSQLVLAGFKTLVEAGYQPESAYFECLHELKLIVDLLYEHGLSGMWFSVSETAEYGGLTRGPRIITDESMAEMRRVLGEIKDGSFARELVSEIESGRPKFNRLRDEAKAEQIEAVGARLRSMMPFLGHGKGLSEVSGG